MSSRNRDLERQAKKLGFALVGLTTRQHRIFRHPRVREQVITAGTASDWRADKNALAMMRRLLRRLEGA